MSVSYAKLVRQQKEEFNGLFFRAWREAEWSRDKEQKAAETIQLAWRRYVALSELAFRQSQAILIQKQYKAYSALMKYKKIQKDRQKAARMAVFNEKATLIQKVWRGFHSRRVKHHFYQRQRFLADVAARSEAMRQSLAAHAAEQRAVQERLRDELMAERYEQIAGHLHHLVGTKNIRGVLAPPSTTVPGAMAPPPQVLNAAEPMMASAIPEDIVKASKQLKEYVKRSTRYFPGKYAVVKKLNDNPIIFDEARSKYAQGPFMPRYRVETMKNRALRPTLRVEDDYDNVEPEREEKRIAQSKIVPATVFKTPKNPDVHYVTSIDNGTGYFQINYGTSVHGFREVAMEKNVSKKDFKGIVPSIPIFDEYRRV